MKRIIEAVCRSFNAVKRATAVLALAAAAATTLPAQTVTTLFSFNGVDGTGGGTLVQDTDGNFCGTGGDGAYHYGVVYRITPTGTLTTLYNFCSLSGCPDGGNPTNGLVLASNGDFYGTTADDGVYGQGGYNYGTVFKITPSGALTTIYSSCAQSGCPTGNQPNGGLIQA